MKRSAALLAALALAGCGAEAEPSLAALARLGPVDVPCSLTTTLVITAA